MKNIKEWLKAKDQEVLLKYIGSDSKWLNYGDIIETSTEKIILYNRDEAVVLKIQGINRTTNEPILIQNMFDRNLLSWSHPAIPGVKEFIHLMIHGLQILKWN